jgi:hypothetical protein
LYVVAACVAACDRFCEPRAAKTSLDRVMYDGRERDPVRHAQLDEHVPEVSVDGVRRDV